MKLPLSTLSVRVQHRKEKHQEYDGIKALLQELDMTQLWKTLKSKVEHGNTGEFQKEFQKLRKLLSHPPEALAMMHRLGLVRGSGKPGMSILVCDHDRKLMAKFWSAVVAAPCGEPLLQGSQSGKTGHKAWVNEDTRKPMGTSWSVSQCI